MRSLPVFFSLLFCLRLVAQTNPGFTLDELQLKRYDSKKKYPATVLRNEPDAFPDLVAVKIFLGKAQYTGKIIDEKGSLKINASVNDGSIVDFSSLDNDANRRQSFHVTTTGKYSWYATDSVFFDNQIFSSAIYFVNEEGDIMMVERIFGYNNTCTETCYRIGFKTGAEFEFDEPLKEGLQSVYHNDHLMSYETYHDGQIDGEVVYYDEEKTVLQRFYVNAYTGLYGTYYELDTGRNVVTIGHYNERGVESGEWISKYADSSLASVSWFGENGNPDSSKAWDVKGHLVQVEYNYWRYSKAISVNQYVHYYKAWYSNGQTHLYTNYNPGPNDTIQSFYDVTGIIQSLERNVGGRVQTKTWYNNGQIQSERYGSPSKIAGVTLRDSVYREWSVNGQLIKERYYDKGNFVRSTDVLNQDAYTDASVGPAYYVVVDRKSSSCKWDTGSLVPAPVLDSVSLMIDYARMKSRQSKPEAEVCFQQVRDLRGVGSSDNPECRYTILLAKQESVKLDSSGKIVTKNAALNQFLDSLHLLGVGVAPIGNYEKRKGKTLSDFSVTTTDTRYFLNLFYINRRLAQLAPGSGISCYTQPGEARLAPEIIYIPQGETTTFGITPVTVIAVAGEGQTKELRVGNRLINWDNRPFYVFNVYADGEVEFARTTYKDTILLQYRGERTGVYSIPQQ